MPDELRMTDDQWAQLRSHLLGDGDEHAAILVCGTVSTPGGSLLVTRKVVLVGPTDLLTSSPLHLSISPVTLARVAKQAAAEHGTVIVCHSHPWSGNVSPSRLDLETEAELCGRALAARVAPRPVGALVLGMDGFSARLWSAGASTPLTRLRVVGDESARWPAPQPEPTSERTARQVLAWGALGQNRLVDARVVIVGAGGTGSQIGMQLAHLGIGAARLIDHDFVETTNLSRLVGAVPHDVGQPKVNVLANAMRRVNPETLTEPIQQSVLDIEPELLADADVIICATDGHGSRALLTEAVQQYLVPVVDLGVEVVPVAESVQAGGQIRVLRPGRGCLHCAGTLEPQLVREEYLDPAEREREMARGYLRGIDAPAPAVIALNGVVASLAVLEVCQLLAGFLGSTSDRLLYRAHRRAVTTAGITRDPMCYVCGETGLLGLGDARKLPLRRSAAQDISHG